MTLELGRNCCGKFSPELGASSSSPPAHFPTCDGVLNTICLGSGRGASDGASFPGQLVRGERA